MHFDFVSNLSEVYINTHFYRFLKDHMTLKSVLKIQLCHHRNKLHFEILK